MPASARLVREPIDHTAEIAAQASVVPAMVLHAVNPLYTRWEEEALPSLQAGLAVAEQLGAHFMLPGNVYNYGESMPPLLSESTPFHPSNRKGEIRVAMEAQMAAWSARTGLSASVVRAGDFFRPHHGHLSRPGGRQVPAGRQAGLSRAAVGCPMPGPTCQTWPGHWCGWPPSPQPLPFDVWHFEGHTVTGHEFLDATEAALARPAACTRALACGAARCPGGLIRLAGWFVPLWRELARMSYLWRTPHRLDGRKLAALPGGPLAATPLRQALRESLLALPAGELSLRGAAVASRSPPEARLGTRGSPGARLPKLRLLDASRQLMQHQRQHRCGTLRRAAELPPRWHGPATAVARIHQQQTGPAGSSTSGRNASASCRAATRAPEAASASGGGPDRCSASISGSRPTWARCEAMERTNWGCCERWHGHHGHRPSAPAGAASGPARPPALAAPREVPGHPARQTGAAATPPNPGPRRRPGPGLLRSR